MATPQVIVEGSDIYQLLADGTLLKLDETATPPGWKGLDKNADNVQLRVGDTPLVRRKGGEVLRWDGKALNKIHDAATNFWAFGKDYYILEKGTGNLLQGDSTNKAWTAIEGANSLCKDLAFFIATLYQLRTDSTVFRRDPTKTPPTWEAFGSGSQIVQIASNDKFHTRYKNGQINVWANSTWTVIANDLRTVEISAGEAGLFQRINNGTIYKHKDGRTWELADSSTDNVAVLTGKSAYRVTNSGNIYRLTDGLSTWQALPNSSVRVKEEEKGNGGNSNENGGGGKGGNNTNNTNNTHDLEGCIQIEAEEVYIGAGTDKTVPTLLRIGNGGAGQVGLLKHISDAFVKDQVSKGAKPFKVAWYKSDTSETINYLKNGTVDVGITYTPAAEQLAILQGIALKPSHYIFREHFLLVGPPSNPAQLDPESTIEEQFAQIYTYAEAGKTKPPVRFLSRYDKSATNIKDAELWIKLGQVPWALKYSHWYHQYTAYPIQALHAAAVLEEYTLSDWGTYLSIDDETAGKLKIYKKGTESAYDPLLMPAHALIGARAKNPVMAKTFVDWLTSKAGQSVVASFQKNGEQVYSAAPRYQ